MKSNSERFLDFSKIDGYLKDGYEYSEYYSYHCGDKNPRVYIVLTLVKGNDKAEFRFIRQELDSVNRILKENNVKIEIE